MTEPLTDDIIDLAIHTAKQACMCIVEDESTEEYFAGLCEDAVPVLDALTAERDRYRAYAVEVDELRRQCAQLETDLAEAMQVVEAAKAVERASHVSERAITNAMAGLRVRIDAYDRED